MAKGFWSEIGKSISNTAKKTAENTGSLLDAAKVRGRISNENKEIERLYRQMGEAVFRHCAGDFSQLSDDDRAAAEEILLHKDNIASLTEELASLKGMKICPGCGELIALDVCFCPKCGTKTPVGPREVKPEEFEGTAEETFDAKPEEAPAPELAKEEEGSEILDAEFQPLPAENTESVPPEE